MKAKKLSKRNKADLDSLMFETILGAIQEDLDTDVIEGEDPRFNEALDYLISELQKMKSV